MPQIDPITLQWVRNRGDQIAAERGFFFHPPSAARVVDFIGKICRVVLMPWQEDEVRRLFGWRRPDGSRRFTRAYISVAKKNGKTRLCSCIAAYVLVCEKGDVVSAANAREQASEVFKDLHEIVNGSKPLARLATVNPSTKSVLIKSTVRSYRAMSADAGTGDGVRAKLVSMMSIIVPGIAPCMTSCSLPVKDKSSRCSS